VGGRSKGKGGSGYESLEPYAVSGLSWELLYTSVTRKSYPWQGDWVGGLNPRCGSWSAGRRMLNEKVGK
jgi:hypothetical protein